MNTASFSNTLRAVVLTGVFGATLFTPIAQAQSAYRPTATDAVGLSRAEVIADTRLWIRAGVDKYADAAQYNVDNRQYQRALAEYHRLRNGPAYAEEVARVEAERGDASATRLSRQ